MFLDVRKSKERRASKNFTKNVPKILDLKSSSEQIFSENWRWVPWFRDATTGFPKKWRLAENVHTDDVSQPRSRKCF